MIKRFDADLQWYLNNQSLLENSLATYTSENLSDKLDEAQL